MNPKLFFAFKQRRTLNGALVHDNPFAPWTVEDLYPGFDDWDMNLAGYREIPWEEEIEEWLLSLDGSYWPLQFLIEQCCHDGELLDLALRETRMSQFPIEAAMACEEAISRVPLDYSDELFFMIYWSVRIERARRRGHPGKPDGQADG